MPLDGEYEPSAQQWVRDQVEQYEKSRGRGANTLRDTGLPIAIYWTRGVKSGKVRKTPLMRVEHDGVYAMVGSQGGAPRDPSWVANLRAYPQVKGEATPVRLENEDDPLSRYELQSGLTDSGGAPYPTHLATWASAQDAYNLDGRDELRVPLTWSEAGVSVTKTFVLHRGAYRIGVQYEVHNGGGAPWAARPYAQILRDDPPTKRSMFNVESYAFHGPAIYDGKSYSAAVHLAEDTKRATLGILLADMSVVRRNVADLVPKRESELRFIVHQPHQLAGHIDIATRQREGVFDTGIERGEVQRLSGICDARICSDTAAHQLNISCARPGFGAAQLPDQLGIAALRLGDVLRIEIAQPLGGGWRESQRCGGSEQEKSAHHPIRQFNSPTT